MSILVLVFMLELEPGLMLVLMSVLVLYLL